MLWNLFTALLSVGAVGFGGWLILFGIEHILDKEKD